MNDETESMYIIGTRGVFFLFLKMVCLVEQLLIEKHSPSVFRCKKLETHRINSVSVLKNKGPLLV